MYYFFNNMKYILFKYNLYDRFGYENIGSICTYICMQLDKANRMAMN